VGMLQYLGESAFQSRVCEILDRFGLVHDFHICSFQFCIRRNDEVSTTAHQVVMALQFSVLGRVLPSVRQPSFDPISKFMTLSSSKFESFE
jgi:hypothetical protein